MKKSRATSGGTALRRSEDVRTLPREAPELRHLPAATYEWYSKNYLDRDYPLRFILMCNGVEFPDTPEEDK